MADAAIPIVSRKRSVAFYVLVGLFSLLLIVFTGFMIPILPSVITGWFNPIFGIHQLHEMGAGAVNWLLLAGVLLQLHKPERKVAPLQMATLVILTSIPIGLIAGTFFPPILLFLAFLVGIAWLHPRRQEMLRLRGPLSPALLAFVALAALPSLIYGANQLTLQQTTTDTHAEFTHYSTMAGLAFTFLLVGLLASFKNAGWRVAAWGAGFLAIIFGLTSVVFPEQSSSVGLLWGSIAVAWGLAFIGAAEWVRLKGR